MAFITLAGAACVQPTGGGGGGGGAVVITASSATVAYGDAVPPITPSYVGLASGQTQTATPPTCTTTATSTSPAGTYPTTCSGAVHGSAAITYVAGTITIAPAPLTITASDAAMVFGGSVPTITASYSGLKNGETGPAVLPICSTTATSSSPAGNYPSTCTGAADPNYSITTVAGTVSVGAALVTVTASSTSSTYGDAAPTISATYAGFLNGETEPATPATCSTTATSSSPVGSYPSSCSGAADPSYVFSYVPGTVGVTPAAAVVTASSATIPFLSAVPAITSSYSGLVNGDTAPATPPTCSTTATSSSPVGDYPSSCSGAADPNYTFSYVGGTITITASAIPVTVTASSATMTYGGSVPAITPTYVGFAGAQTTPATSPATCSTTATSSSPVGTYPSTCSGAADPNYSFSYVAGTVTVEAAAATVTASSDTMTYGGSVPTITPSYSGLVNGDTAPATAPTCSTTATSASAVGSYPSLCAGAADPNYTFSAVAGSVSVTKAALTVTASSGNSVYGDPAPAITAGYSGFVNGDTAPATAPTCSTTATSASPVGSYASTCSGADDPDYTFTYVNGSVSVTPRAAVITASSDTMVQGSSAPTITPSYSGLVNGDTAAVTAPTCSTTATAASAPGSYPSSCVGAADPDYTFSYVGGTVTVTPFTLPTLTVTAPSVDMELGQPAPALTPTYSGFLNGETAPATPPTCSTTATAASPIGTYPSSCTGAADPGYDIVYVAGTVTVHPTPGLGAYDPTGHATTIAAGSNGVNLPNGTLNVASALAAGFETYTNLTVQTSNGPQPMFCKVVNATSFTTCTTQGGTGQLAAGNFVIDKAAHQFDTFTVAGGKAAISPTSLTILSDVPAANRGMGSVVRLTASNNNGLIVYTPAAAPSGTFTLTYGICRAGTATYSAASSTCTTGVIEYQNGVQSKLGADVTATVLGSPLTSHVYQKVRSATVTPTAVPQGTTFRSRFTPAAAAIPRLQDSGTAFGDATVGSSSRMAAVIPIPAGMTYVSSRVLGGDAATSGVATVTYCTTFGAAPCHAKPATGNYINNSLPYLVVAMPAAAAAVPGGGQISMPMIEVTMTATGSPGTVAQWKVSEFITRISANLIVSIILDFDGYPTDDSNKTITPPLAPPTIVATTTIT